MPLPVPSSAEAGGVELGAAEELQPDITLCAHDAAHVAAALGAQHPGRVAPLDRFLGLRRALAQDLSQKVANR